ncbi:MAG: PaaI family thioesterase [Alphaproteobacteria bacterium]|nr:PaaI family thioesterase [Alphaproteobacteria bacterium]
MDATLIEPPYPMQAHLGFEMHEWNTDEAIFHLPLQHHHMNRYGIPHGGLYALLLDTVMGYAGCYTGDRDAPAFAMTLNMNVSFLGRPVGNKLICRATKIGGGRKIFFAEGTVKDELGNMVATGTGTFRYNNSPYATQRPS